MCKKILIILLTLFTVFLILNVCKVEAKTNESHTHTFTSNANSKYLKSAATCTSAAIYYKSCSKCGAKGTATFKSGNALGHKYEKNATKKYLKSAATCTSAAVYYKSCSRCGAKGTATFKYGNALGHKYENNTTKKYLKSAATCTSAAFYYESCSRCGIQGKATFKAGEALGHKFNSKNTCIRCGFVYLKLKTEPGIKKVSNELITIQGNKNGPFEIDCKFDVAYDYWIYIPDSSVVDNYYNIPLIVFLHGKLEGESLNAIESRSGLPMYIKDGYENKNSKYKNLIKELKAIVIAPRYKRAYTEGYTMHTEGVAATINYIISKESKWGFKIDQSRISITGFSLGGAAAASTLFKYNGKFSRALLLSPQEDPTSANRSNVTVKCPTKILFGTRETTRNYRTKWMDYSKGQKNFEYIDLQGKEHAQVSVIYSDINNIRFLLGTDK